MRLFTLLYAALATNAARIPQQPLNVGNSGTPLPLLIWHGLGDRYDREGIKQVIELAEKANPGTFVYPVHLSEDGSADQRATFVGNVNEQIEYVCKDLASHPILSTAPAINGLGFSQGGQFLRAYIERCNNPPVANLVTFGAQHNGIAEFQACKDGDWLCNGWESILKGQTWTNFVQTTLVPAQYFRNPDDLESYLEYSNFLANINNERTKKNATYVENMKRLEKFVMYVFENETTVVPKWSGWFDEFNLTSAKRTKLQDRDLYKEDWLGLRWLDERGRLVFKETEGGHMTLTVKLLMDTFTEYFSRRVDVLDTKGSLDL